MSFPRNANGITLQAAISPRMMTSPKYCGNVPFGALTIGINQRALHLLLPDTGLYRHYT